MAIGFDAAVAFDSPDYTFDGVFAGMVTPDPNPVVGTLNFRSRATLDFTSRALVNLRRSGTLETE